MVTHIYVRWKMPAARPVAATVESGTAISAAHVPVAACSVPEDRSQ